MRWTSIGDRNVRVVFQKNTPTTAGDGQQVAAWTDKFKRSAEVIPRSGREGRIFEQLRAEVDYIVRVTHDSGTVDVVPADWRIKIGSGSTAKFLNIGATYDIHSGRRMLEMQCTEVVA